MFPVSATGSVAWQPDPRLAASATRLVAGDLGVRADVVERARQDRDEHGARVRAADRGAVVPALASGDGADDEPDCQDDGAKSHQFLFLYRFDTYSTVRPSCRARPLAGIGRAPRARCH